MIVLLLAINLLWSIAIRVEDRVSGQSGTEWFSLTDTDTAANLLGLAVTLALARAQWARLHRPTISFSIDDEGEQFSGTSTVWRFWVANAGPGGAVVDRLEFRVRFTHEFEDGIPPAWHRAPAITELLAAEGLEDGRDFFIRLLGNGSPLPATTRYSESLQFAWFTVHALAHLRRFDVRVRLRDNIGDIHQRDVALLNSLPSVTKDLVARVRHDNALRPSECQYSDPRS